MLKENLVAKGGRSAAEERALERQKKYEQVLKEREKADQKQRARTAELRAMRLAKEAADREAAAKASAKN